MPTDLTLGLGYMLAGLSGSIPFAWLLVRWRTGQDIRQLYSGNVGATNARRILGWGGFLLVFLLDAGKAAGPCLLAVVHVMILTRIA